MNVDQPDVAFAPFDRTDVGAVKSASFSEVVLCPPLLFPQGAKPLTESLSRVHKPATYPPAGRLTDDYTSGGMPAHMTTN